MAATAALRSGTPNMTSVHLCYYIEDGAGHSAIQKMCNGVRRMASLVDYITSLGRQAYLYANLGSPSDGIEQL